MIPHFVFATLNEDGLQFCKFNVTVYCEAKNLDIARKNAEIAAANVDGAIMAKSSQRAMFVNGDEHDECFEIIDPMLDDG